MNSQRSQLGGLVVAFLFLGLLIGGSTLIKTTYTTVVWQPRCVEHIVATMQPAARSQLAFVDYYYNKQRASGWCVFRDTSTQAIVEIRFDHGDGGLIIYWGIWWAICLVIGGRLSLAYAPKPVPRLPQQR